MSITPRRLASENITVKLRPVDAPGAMTHDLDVAISYDVRDRRVVEIAFVTRGKVGGGMDLMFTDLGMQLSRAIQGRDIDTGEPSPHSALNLKNQIYGFSESESLAATQCMDPIADEGGSMRCARIDILKENLKKAMSYTTGVPTNLYAYWQALLSK